jgi:hypothetical protein
MLRYERLNRFELDNNTLCNYEVGDIPLFELMDFVIHDQLLFGYEWKVPCVCSSNSRLS